MKRNLKITGFVFMVIVFLIITMPIKSIYAFRDHSSFNLIGTPIGTPTPGDDFVITVKSDHPGTSFSTEFTIPTYSGVTYNYNVDCRDDGIYEVTGAAGDYTCSFGKPGTYTIRIRDNSGVGTGFPSIYFNDAGDKEKLLTIEQWGTGQWATMSNAFYGCVNLTDDATDVPDLSNVTSMYHMFRNASSFNGYIGDWDTSNIATMHGTFYNATAFNQDIGGWNTANVHSMNYMFVNAGAFNQNIGWWNTGAVTGMSYMFYGAADFDQDIGDWDTSAVANMNAMFRYANDFNQDIGDWDTAAVAYMHYMFQYSLLFNQDIGDWNTAAVTNMKSMFYGASAFNQDISAWDTGAVTDMSYMFRSAAAFNQDIGGWNTAAVTDTISMFYGASVFNQDISAWDTGAVTDMSYMFRNAAAFNQDIGGWDTGSVTGMSYMFYNNPVFNQDLSAWDVGAVTNMSNMFNYTSDFNQPIGSWDTGSTVNMDSMFSGATAFNQDIGGWDVSQLSNAEDMFLDVKLSTANYDALLNGWDAQVLQSSVLFSGGDSTYCSGEAARANMESSDLWTITDGGKDCTVPVPKKPIGDISDTTPKYAWTKVAGATLYHFQLYQGGTFVYNQFATDGYCGPTYCGKTPAVALALDDYHWKVRAQIGGIWGDWSDSLSFTVTTPPIPRKPTGDITDTTPKYAWTVAPGATLYHFQLYQGGTFIYNQFATDGYCGPDYCGKTPAAALPLGDYQWKVRAQIGGLWEPWSSYLPFTINP